MAYRPKPTYMGPAMAVAVIIAAAQAQEDQRDEGDHGGAVPAAGH